MLLPGAAGEKNQNGENLQSACQHIQDQYQLGQHAVACIITGRTDCLQTGTNIIKACQHRAEIRTDGESIQRDHNKTEQQYDHVGRQVRIGAVQNLFVHHLIIDADGLNPAVMQHLMDVSPENLEQQQRPGTLQTASGGAGAGTHHHQKQQNALAESRPQTKIRGCKACRRHNGGHLKRRMTNRLAQTSIEAPEIQGNQQDAAKENAHIQPKLLISPYASEITDHQQIIAAKIHAEQHHKDCGHILDIGGIACQGIVLHAEDAGARRAEGRAL